MNSVVLSRKKGEIPVTANTILPPIKSSESSTGARVGVDTLMMAARANWRHMSGSGRRAEVIEGIALQDGIRQLKDTA